MVSSQSVAFGSFSLAVRRTVYYQISLLIKIVSDQYTTRLRVIAVTIPVRIVRYHVGTFSFAAEWKVRECR